MKKLIKVHGNSAAVVLTKEDLKCYNLKIGNCIDFKINKETN